MNGHIIINKSKIQINNSNNLNRIHNNNSRNSYDPSPSNDSTVSSSNNSTISHSNVHDDNRISITPPSSLSSVNLQDRSNILDSLNVENSHHRDDDQTTIMMMEDTIINGSSSSPSLSPNQINHQLSSLTSEFDDKASIISLGSSIGSEHSLRSLQYPLMGMNPFVVMYRRLKMVLHHYFFNLF